MLKACFKRDTVCWEIKDHKSGIIYQWLPKNAQTIFFLYYANSRKLKKGVELETGRAEIEGKPIKLNLPSKTKCLYNLSVQGLKS